MPGKKEKKKVGRPAAVTENVIEKLKDGFRRGLNIRQCCLYAEISPDCYYNFIKRNPEYNDVFDQLRENTALRAVLNVSDEINSRNIDLSKWYLERRCRDEYSTKNDIGIAANIGLSLSDKESALADFLSGFLEE